MALVEGRLPAGAIAFSGCYRPLGLLDTSSMRHVLLCVSVQMAPQRQEMEDLVCSVATHAFAVLARVCVGELGG